MPENEDKKPNAEPEEEQWTAEEMKLDDEYQMRRHEHGNEVFKLVANALVEAADQPLFATRKTRTHTVTETVEHVGPTLMRIIGAGLSKGLGPMDPLPHKRGPSVASDIIQSALPIINQIMQSYMAVETAKSNQRRAETTAAAYRAAASAVRMPPPTGAPSYYPPPPPPPSVPYEPSPMPPENPPIDPG